jgi:mono/diheme cytochrome c family protein
MRGVIEVVDRADPDALARLPRQEAPLYQKLGLDLDAMAELDPRAELSLAQLTRSPSAERGQALHGTLPAELLQRDKLRTHSPAEAFLLLKGQNDLSDAQIWDRVAFVWRESATQETRARGARLYARDCAACHGEQGRGDGPAGRDLPGLQKMMPELKQGPADFTDLRRMSALSDVYLQGKLLRGGMGTGMPEFGSLYSLDDQWSVIAFVRGFMMKDRDLDNSLPTTPGLSLESGLVVK